MRPPFNTLPYRPKQVPTNGTSAPSATQQVFPPNHCQGNPSNFFPNSQQIQSQMGIMSPQIAFPFNQSNTHMNIGSMAMPNRPVSVPVGSQNHLLHQQNGMPFMGQCSNGSMAPMNAIQSPNVLFAQNAVNLPQYLNQNAGFPNGQLRLQSPMQNMNQFVQIPMPNYAQVGPCNMTMYPSQVSPGLGPQNPIFLTNPQFGMVKPNAVMQPNNQDQRNVVLPMDANAAKQVQNSTQQSQGNSPVPPASGSVPPHQTQKGFHPPAFKMPQGNLRKDCGTKSVHANWNNSQNRNYKKIAKGDPWHRGFQKNHKAQNAKGKFGFYSKPGGKGYKNDGGRKPELLNSANKMPMQQKRSIPLNYTEQEIQQWREARRKNYPSKVNVEKRLGEKMTELEIIDTDAKLRRQQLKEVLAKQAELGCEVAEIPSCYLSDSEKQVHGSEPNKKALTKKERFQNKFNKRGRSRQNERFQKEPKLADHDPSSTQHDLDERLPKMQKLAAGNDMSQKLSLKKTQPTLLQKLLSADIKRDKSRLLQVFRFMAMNSFFKDWPKKPLVFPLVMVKETGLSGEVVAGNHLSSGKLVCEIKDKAPVEETGYVGDNNGDYDEELSAQENAAYFSRLNGSIEGEAAEPEEEEGEIID